MSDRYREQWERLGETDPYWAVLTSPEKRGGKWGFDEFFLTGEREVEAVLGQLADRGVPVNRRVALDFGCGVGRLSRALAKQFEKVVAVDVSTSMLAEARRVNHEIRNIEFIHNDGEDLAPVPEAGVDFLYSNIVLQHMPKGRQLAYIREFCRVLRSGGVLAIQTPSRYRLKSWQGWLSWLAGNRVLNVLRALRHGRFGVMEMHVLPKDEVLRSLAQNDMELLHVERYDSAGPAFESYRYFARKQPNGG